ncbi:hypothetical protein JHK84_034186 [Glycine max]|nr:hypothetical protein JHK84_034186 [Glycine max]
MFMLCMPSVVFQFVFSLHFVFQFGFVPLLGLAVGRKGNCALILIEILMAFQITCLYLVVALDVIGVVDEMFLSYLNEVEDERPIVILLTHARIKEGQAPIISASNNSLKASKLMTNELVLEIQEFKKRLLDLGIKQFVFVTADDVRSMLDSTDPIELESQSVSVTADHDPLLRIPLTPTKHVSSDELDDEPKNFEISPAQVSSNKLPKHCQAE